MILAVIDANVVISAFLSPRGSPAQLLRSLAAGGFDIVLSIPIINEYRESICKGKVLRLAGRSDAEAQTFVVCILQRMCQEHLVSLSTSHPPITRDPHDDVYIHTALAGKADYLVSGDRYILDLAPAYEDVHIVTPAQFLAIVGGVGSYGGRQPC